MDKKNKNHENVLCECGASLLNKEKSTENWAVYDCVCSQCGTRSQKAADEIRRLVLSSALKKVKR